MPAVPTFFPSAWTTSPDLSKYALKILDTVSTCDTPPFGNRKIIVALLHHPPLPTHTTHTPEGPGAATRVLF